MSNVAFGTNTPSLRKTRLYYTGTSTIYEGMPVCYDYDATTNVLGWDNDASQALGTTTDEGYQNEGKFLRVENPATANLNWFAGVVAAGGYVGKVGPKWVDVYEPNGAIMPVRTNLSTTVGVTVMGIGNGLQYFTTVTGDGDPLPCALAEETVDRSVTNGIVLAKVSATGTSVSALDGYFAPVRSATTGDFGGVRINADGVFTGAGTGGPRSWGLYITGDKESGVITVAGADDAGIRVSINNYVANAEIFNFRGLNVAANNRDGGILGELDNVISVSAKQGSTNSKIWGLNVDAQSLSADTADEMIGLDVSFNREGGVSTEEAGIRVRTRGTINTAVNTAIRISKDATDHGFINLFNIESDAVDVEAATGDTAHDGSDIVIPIVYNGSTYYIVAQDSKG